LDLLKTTLTETLKSDALRVPAVSGGRGLISRMAAVADAAFAKIEC
jgi:hypothetical protein